jgi:hypothetical protein
MNKVISITQHAKYARSGAAIVFPIHRNHDCALPEQAQRETRGVGVVVEFPRSFGGPLFAA